MAGVDRETFLAKVRDALGRAATQPPPPPPEIDDAVVRLADIDEDLPALFTRCATEVGMHVRPIDSSSLSDQLADLLRELGIKSAAATPELAGAVRDSGIELYDWRQSDAQDGLFDVDAGITGVTAALAETGTLVVAANPDHARGLSLIPQTHIAVLYASSILPDMIDLWPRYAGVASNDLPSSIVFITGPSKTADIEGQLVQGVHGPGEVYILLVTDA